MTTKKIPGDFVRYSQRREQLVKSLKEAYPKQSGVILLFAGFEDNRTAFRQESSFYYLTGIKEPGVVLLIDLDGKQTLYVPHFPARSQWVMGDEKLVPENAAYFGLDAIEWLSDIAGSGYQFHPFFSMDSYARLLGQLKNIEGKKQAIFTLAPTNEDEYIHQRLILQRLILLMPSLQPLVHDISSLVAQQRRIKDKIEIEALYRAIATTQVAHESAAQAIDHMITEAEVQAGLEYMMTAAGGRPAFPSIVASGKSSTVLHYNLNNGTMKNGELVVVDIGAEVDYYCADLTRTYPVSGKFSKRQKEIYDMVLATQDYIASLARPGYWLFNAENQEKSLHHLAKAFLAKKGYDRYFTHGIGHFLGIDVHDVGNRAIPLQEGDVITIEPGIYIPQEAIGVRIEDNYWIVNDGVVCLSEQLPKNAEEIEQFMEQEDEFDEDDEEGFEIDEDEISVTH